MAEYCCDDGDTTADQCDGVCIPYDAASLIGFSMCRSTADDVEPVQTYDFSESSEQEVEIEATGMSNNEVAIFRVVP